MSSSRNKIDLRPRSESDDLADRLRARSRDVRRTTPIGDADRREILVLCIDTSASMAFEVDGDRSRLSKLDAVRDAVQMLANTVQMTQSHLTHLECVEFNDVGYVVSPWLAASSAIGSTNLADGLNTAYSLIASRSKFAASRIALLTDGRPTSPVDAVETAIRTAVDFDITIDTVAFGRDADRFLLRKVATVTRGLFYEASSAADLLRCFARLDTASRGLLVSRLCDHDREDGGGSKG